MPPIPLPPGVPLEIGWYAVWIAVLGMLIFVLRVLGDPQRHLEGNARKESEGRLPALNEYLWRLGDESSKDPYNSPLESADDLVRLLDRVRRASAPITRHGRLERHANFGFLACSVGILGAFPCGGLFLAEYPTRTWAGIISIAAFAMLVAWALWHLVHVLVYYFQLVRASDEA